MSQNFTQHEEIAHVLMTMAALVMEMGTSGVAKTDETCTDAEGNTPNVAGELSGDAVHKTTAQGVPVPLP